MKLYHFCNQFSFVVALRKPLHFALYVLYLSCILFQKKHEKAA